ncbi:MAG: hypothetical protein ABIP28_01435 [Mucilaginibacter sp.]
MFSNGGTTYLVYLIEDPKEGDGKSLTMIDSQSETVYPLALVSFEGSTFRFGIANDEVFSGLPLYNHGLKAYRAHIVEHSEWIEELKGIHKVHPYYNEDSWRDRNHYMLLFHDEIFEVVARGYKIEVFETTFERLSVEVVKRMNTKI